MSTSVEGGGTIIDLHSHILPGIDDGAPVLSVAIDMARAYLDQNVGYVVCTPHIFPGLYHNSGPEIRAAVARLQDDLAQAGLDLQLFPGADNHMVPTFVDDLVGGKLLAIADTRYVLVEPPHHVAPARMDRFFADLLTAGYVPLLTHPERLTWIEQKYELVRALARAGVWMQVTTGSLTGNFGRRARYWAERMLDDGLVHVLASDAHDVGKRAPDIASGWRAAEALVGTTEARHLLATRPIGVLRNLATDEIPLPHGVQSESEIDTDAGARPLSRGGSAHGLAGRLRRLLD